MSEDIIAQAESACAASLPKGPMTEESFMIIDNRSRLLPRLLAEAKQQAELIKRLRHDLNISTCNEEVAIVRHVKTRAMEERDAWKAEAIEERAKHLYCQKEETDDLSWWELESEEYKKPYRDEATKMLAEEMTHRPFDPFLKDAASYVTGDIHTEWTRKEDYDKLREAVIKERAVRSMMRCECVHAYDGVQPSKDCLDSAERELRAEGVLK